MLIQGGVGQSPTEEDQLKAQQFVREVDDLRLRALMVSFGRDRQSDEDEQVWWSSVASRGYMQPRMWAQYGNGHQGACVVFDRLRIDDAAQALTALGDARGEDVRYTETFSSSSASLATIMSARLTTPGLT